MTSPKATSKELERQIEEQLLSLKTPELILFLLISYIPHIKSKITLVNFLYFYLISVGWVTVFLIGTFSPREDIYKNIWIVIYTLVCIVYLKFAPKQKDKYHYINKNTNKKKRARVERGYSE